jgi:hypothetical protein
LKKRRKTEISLEIEEAIAIRTECVVLAHCSECRSQMRMIAANEAGIIAKLRTRDIYRLVETGRLHFIEDPNGLLFVCSASLRRLGSESDSAE